MASVPAEAPVSYTRQQEISRLIKQLGDEEFAVRTQAEEQLIELGTDAFDSLQAAEQHPDLEIATRVKYILYQMQVEWVRTDDSPAVRSAMDDYGNLSQAERFERIEQLDNLPEDEGLTALLRIARFETSPITAKRAALAIINHEFESDAETTRRVEFLSQQLAEPNTLPIKWLHIHLDQLQAVEEVDPRWLAEIDAEIERVSQEGGDADTNTVSRLLHHLLQQGLRADDAQSLFDAWQRQTDFFIEQDHELRFALAKALTWLIDKQQWEAFGLLEDHYRDAIEEDRLLTYLSAISRAKQGEEEQAQQYADRAFDMEEEEMRSRAAIADLVAELGRHDWAEREWRAVVDSLPATDIQAMVARRSLALLCLHDRGENQAAAQLLGEALDAIDANPNLKRAFRENQARQEYRNVMESQKNYFLACHAEQQGDYQEQRQYLDKAIEFDPLDADVLIAMYHLQDADEAYREKTRKRIEAAAMIVEREIKQNPEAAQNYNHWAWLISNTEGDYQKAVEYSKRSLELKPDSPSFLDTLGRCYYAAGDLENAVKHQRRAVQMHPQVHVMQKQLALFERELEKRKQSTDAS